MELADPAPKSPLALLAKQTGLSAGNGRGFLGAFVSAPEPAPDSARRKRTTKTDSLALSMTSAESQVESRFKAISQLLNRTLQGKPIRSDPGHKLELSGPVPSKNLGP